MRESVKGFTLLEVLVALTITAIVLSTVYGVFAGISETKERLEQDGAGFHQARVIFSRISREVRSGYFLRDQSDTLFRGGKEDRFFFLELTTTVVSPIFAESSGISRVRYEMRENTEDAKALPVLFRKEEPLMPGSEAEAIEHRLATSIHEFRVRFFNGEDWQDEWDSTQQGIVPHSIEIYLEIEAEGERLPFLTAFEVPHIGKA